MSRRLLFPLVVATLLVPLMAPVAANAAPSPVSSRAFGAHVLGLTGRPYPAVQFGSARIWDMGVTWRELQPKRAGSWDAAAVSRLDGIVASFRARHVEPLLTLGMTPRWAASTCSYHRYGVNWGKRTCAPKSMSYWTSYVRTLAKRYKGKVRYFELWNEPSLANGYNGSVHKLATMQSAARSILHSYGEQLVAPSIPYTDGGPTHGLTWLDQFLSLPGGKSFDIFGAHLYPTDATAKAGYGPEWSMDTLRQVRAVLKRHHVSKPVWNTETNVGRTYSHTTFTGWKGAGMVARTYILATQNHVSRTFWYAADDRSWGGTWLENSNYRTLAAPGQAYRTAYTRLVGARPYGCTRSSVGTNKWHYTCRYRIPGGKNMLAVWSTSRSFTYRTPAGTQHVYNAKGGSLKRGRISVGAAPIYVIGTFHI